MASIFAHFSVVLVVRLPAIGMPFLMVSVSLIDCSRFSAVRTFSTLIVEFLLALCPVPNTLFVTLVLRNSLWSCRRLILNKPAIRSRFVFGVIALTPFLISPSALT
jgi:hypothetical protein